METDADSFYREIQMDVPEKDQIPVNCIPKAVKFILYFEPGKRDIYNRCLLGGLPDAFLHQDTIHANPVERDALQPIDSHNIRKVPRPFHPDRSLVGIIAGNASVLSQRRRKPGGICRKRNDVLKIVKCLIQLYQCTNHSKRHLFICPSGPYKAIIAENNPIHKPLFSLL